MRLLRPHLWNEYRRLDRDHARTPWFRKWRSRASRDDANSGQTVDDCIMQYRVMAERIFSSKSKKPDVLYDARVLEACVEEAIKKAGLTKDTMLDNRDSLVGCRTFVV